jgi:hypothetical protein
MRAMLPIIVACSLVAGACFGGGGDEETPPVDDPSATPSGTQTPTPTTLTPSPSATPSATLSPTPTASPSATATPEPTDSASVCMNDPDDSAAIVGLRTGATAYADELANIRGDHSIDATRVAQVRIAGSQVRVVDGPWCNAEFTWWRVEAEAVVLADDAGDIEGGETGSATGWVAEIDQHGVVNLGPDAALVGQEAP